MIRIIQQEIREIRQINRIFGVLLLQLYYIRFSVSLFFINHQNKHKNYFTKQSKQNQNKPQFLHETNNMSNFIAQCTNKIVKLKILIGNILYFQMGCVCV